MLSRLDPPDPQLSRSLYERVGEAWHWTDRLGWGSARWRAHLAHAQTWVGHLDGEPAGYAELVRTGGDVEITSFGLLPGFAGRGLGGALLARATQEAWKSGAERIWLHTCSLDSPAALPSYERRGFPEICGGDGHAVTWVVDASNVIGSRPDGWWRDRAGAARRLVAELDAFAAATGDPVVVVLDGGEPPAAERAEVVVASRRGRDAADDEIVALLEARGAAGARVVTSDAELARRVRALGAEVEGAGAFRRRLN